MDAKSDVRTILDDFAQNFSPTFRDSAVYQAVEQFLLTTDTEYVNNLLCTDEYPHGPIFATVKWVLQGLDHVDSSSYPLRPIIEEAIFFFTTDLGPYYYWMDTSAYSQDPRGYPMTDTPHRLNVASVELRFWRTIQLIAMAYREDYSENPIVDRKWRAGLLRDGLVRILEAVFRAGMSELRTRMMKVASTQKDSEIVNLDSFSSLLGFFVSDPRFRSERMENTILKYLNEEGVVMEVVDGVRDATAKYKREYAEFVEERGLALFTLGEQINRVDAALYRSTFKRRALQDARYA